MINEPLILPNNNDQGIAPLGFAQPGTMRLPDPKVIAGNILRQKALETVGRKVGLPALGKVLGFQSFVNPLGMAAFGPAGIGIGALQGLSNTTFGRSRNIAEYLAVKRQQKAEEAMDRQQRRAQDYARTDARRAMTTDTAYSGGGGEGMSNAQAAANREGRRGGQYG